MATAASNGGVVDFHSHCLPGIDDGAADVKTACAMLKLAGEQGVDTVVATSHFYWGEHTVESFLQARQEAYDRLRPFLNGLPQVRLGAEVLLREGISRLDLRPLCIEGTDVLLVELPFTRAPGWLIEELENIVYNQKLTLMFAHLDRYMAWYSAERAATLLDLPDAIVQINTETITDRGAYRALRKWLPATDRLVFGSDMHNLRGRAPEWDVALRMLNKKRQGRDWLSLAEDTTEELI